MDAMADVQPTQNESTENWMRDEKMVGGSVRWSSSNGSRGLGEFHKGNKAAACFVAMITNKEVNNAILLP